MSDDDDLRDLAPHIDAAFYHGLYPDIAATQTDAVVHYTRTGWREGRNPNPWFDTSHYLRTYPDVRDSLMNPLLHYIRQGKFESRVTAPPGGIRRVLLERLERVPAPKWIEAAPEGTAYLGAAELTAALAPSLAVARGFAMSLSHDNYLRVSGGTQAVIADEQRKYNGSGWTYLHLSPTRAGQTLAEPGRAPDMQLVCDGVFLGAAPVAAIMAALAWLPLARVFIVHSLLGHEPEDVARLAAVVDAGRNVFWAHDYFAACEGYRLLRNDLAYCHGPPPDSMACLVCVHGATRATHLARMRSLFARVAFDVVAPSKLALDTWLRTAELPLRAARSHAHCSLVPLGGPSPGRAPENVALRVAYVGAAEPHKGWFVFQELVRLLGASPDYWFAQFADADALRPQANLKCIAASVRPDAPLAMVAALREARIDLVLLLSPWPETFSLVTMEALAAGADVVALAASGNAAAIVATTSRGVVLEDEAALWAFFASGDARGHASRRRRKTPPPTALLWTGTTATLDVPAGPVTTREADLRFLVDGVSARPRREGDAYCLDLDGAVELRVLSRHASPADVRPGSSDWRRLGVAFGRILVDGRELAQGDPCFAAGWHGGAAPFWTDGDARFAVVGLREMRLTLADVAPAWRIA